MIEVIRDDKGNLKAVVEYYIVNQDGSMNDKGIYCWINECEISPQYRNNGCIGKFVNIITKKYPQLKAGYYHRLGKYPNRLPKMFTRNQWLRLTSEEKDEAD